MTSGIIFAFVAMLGWGIGDFLIQKSTRRSGVMETLFFICSFGSVFLLPFVWNDIPALFQIANFETLIILSVASVILFAGALFCFLSYKRGKLSVVEPILSLEILVTSYFAYVILSEKLTFLSVFFIILLVFGLILTSYRGEARDFLEKGIFLAVGAALLMGIADFFVGWGARETSALMVNFFFNTVIAGMSAVYIFKVRGWGTAFQGLIRERVVYLPMIIIDNIAWIAFAFSMTLMPIGIATALSESYILIAVILGLILGKEHLKAHQKIGLVFALGSALILAFITV